MSIPYSTLVKGKDRLYTHISADGSFVVSLAVTQLKNAIGTKLVPPSRITLSAETATLFLEQGMVDIARLRLILANPLMLIEEPIVMLAHPDGTGTLIEGHADYVASLQMGRTDILVRRVPQSHWSKFIVTGVPFTDAQLTSMADSRRLDNKKVN